MKKRLRPRISRPGFHPVRSSPHPCFAPPRSGSRGGKPNGRMPSSAHPGFPELVGFGPAASCASHLEDAEGQDCCPVMQTSPPFAGAASAAPAENARLAFRHVTAARRHLYNDGPVRDAAHGGGGRHATICRLFWGDPSSLIVSRSPADSELLKGAGAGRRAAARPRPRGSPRTRAYGRRRPRLASREKTRGSG
jgi:hypothetical protein